MSAPLTAPCDSCGASDGLLIHTYGNCAEHYCKRCAQRNALYTAAYDNLELLVRQAVAAWLPVWGDLPGVIDLHEQLGQIGGKLEDEWKAGAFDQEGVQTFPRAV